jgi:DNA-binding response OmpR family regulator
LTTAAPANGRRILVAEDGYLLAEVICDCLRDWGMEPLGPVSRLQDACCLAQQGALDGAVLDVKLGDELSFPVAWILRMRGIPFVFLTGYSGNTRIPLPFREAPLIEKPFAAEDLREALGALPLAQSMPALVASQVPRESSR